MKSVPSVVRGIRSNKALPPPQSSSASAAIVCSISSVVSVVFPDRVKILIIQPGIICKQLRLGAPKLLELHERPDGNSSVADAGVPADNTLSVANNSVIGSRFANRLQRRLAGPIHHDDDLRGFAFAKFGQPQRDPTAGFHRHPLFDRRNQAIIISRPAAGPKSRKSDAQLNRLPGQQSSPTHAHRESRLCGSAYAMSPGLPGPAVFLFPRNTTAACPPATPR